MPKQPEYVTESQVLELLRQRQGGLSQKEYANKIGISPQFLNDILLGRRGIHDDVLAFLGLEDAGRVYRKRGKKK